MDSYSSEPSGVMIAFVLIFMLVIVLLPMIFFLLTMQNTLLRIRPEFRKITPGQVWLTFIPLFGLVWQFIMVSGIADSLAAEFRDRGMVPQEERPGHGIGLTYCILYCCSIIPFIGWFTSLGGFICWIVYWVKINNYKNQLGEYREQQVYQNVDHSF
ncbi:MAG: hypothetical protein H6581_15370 [Bacteroidia bacterium]|nr:hypothetical protein [Bacteroidia bacterium]